ncbi:MAG TPA: hypothetical protein VJ732_19440 [Bryobacteraceae bacterium]|nr:hypothetical protein [Bryobacteraceae bacterium]
MATIKLTDQFGLDLDARPAAGSALLKYFQQLPSLRLDNLDLKKLGGLTLDEPAVRSFRTGVSFQDPVSIGDGAPELSIGGGVHGSLEIITDAGSLPGHDDAVELPPDTCYVAFGLDATASATLSAASGRLQFGASPASAVDATSYSRFPLKAGISLPDAVEAAVAQFAIPFRCADLVGLRPGQIAKAAVSGKLALSGSVDLLAVSNPLASAALPAPLPAVSVSAGGSATIGASWEMETEYEMVARRLDHGAVRLGWYHRAGTEVTVRAQLAEGISAGFGGADLFSTIIGMISGDAKADLQELRNAGVPEEQAQKIQAAVKAATCRKLEIAISSEVSSGGSRAATFLFDLDPGALNDASRAAVDRALRGDLTGLHGTGLAGVSPVRSLWDKVCERGLELDVNLLGILNYRSVAKLSLEGTVLYEPATGALVITDQATADRIRSAQVNFGADTQKLRHVLAESFLITAAYRGAKKALGGAALRCRHTFFELQNATSAADMSRKLRTGAALGLLVGDDEKLPEGVADFGRTLFMAATDYDDELVSRMFVDAAGAALGRDVYESAGRAAIQFLVQTGDGDAVRRRPAIDDDLWRRMKEAGQPGFGSLFPGIAAPLLAAITADYSTVQWWAEAMQSTAVELARLRGWLARNPGPPMDDPEFQNLRQDLAGHLREVARNTREEFGEPWGLIAMNQLAGQAAGAKILITGPKLVRGRQRALAAATEP